MTQLSEGWLANKNGEVTLYKSIMADKMSVESVKELSNLFNWQSLPNDWFYYKSASCNFGSGIFNCTCSVVWRVSGWLIRICISS